MQRIRFSVTLTLKGPLLTQASTPGELGLDMVVARHQVDETPYLSGTLINGKLRQALEELDSLQGESKPTWFEPKLSEWLGERHENSFPKTKQIYTSDFDLEKISQDKLERNLIRDRITIDKETGAVKKHHIVMMENPFVSGESYNFTGEIHFFSAKDQADNIIKHIKTGFNWLTHLGAMKSIGFGQINAIQFTEEKKQDITPPTDTETSEYEAISLSIKPTYPFCLPDKPVSDNLFESAAIIPGAAIIGSIATTWGHLRGKHTGLLPNQDNDFKELKENFSKIRITHAFPSTSTKRPVVAPLSLVKTFENADTYYDVAQISSPCLINNAPPDFAMDWKDNEETLKEYPWPFLRLKKWGWSTLDSELRVRTAIDRDSYRSAEGELFAYEQILPEDNEWQATLDASRIEDIATRKKVVYQLQSLLKYGVIGLGKTKTPTTITFNNRTTDTKLSGNDNPINDNIWIITLQTDTLLGSPENLNEASGKKELESMYQSAWESISSDKLKLVRYFARQKLAGGNYRKNRFPSKDDLYRPWLLTEAGSVFVLRATGEPSEAKSLVQNWLKQGLTLGEDTRDYYNITTAKEDWEQCPYIPQNGYGEIIANLDLESAGITVLTDNSQTVSLIETINEEEG